MEIVHATLPKQVEEARRLFREYQESVGTPECFSSFEEELKTLPGNYSRPGGGLFLAMDQQISLGCVGLRQLDETTCELKRLYVRPEARGLQIGRKLIEHAAEYAKREGYQRVRLDTLPTMTAAIRLYRALGFIEIPAYTYNPVAGILYFELTLERK